MLKKLMIVTAFLASSAIAVPCHADPNVGCMLNSGCFFETGDTGGHWVCLDPGTYALCDEG